MKYADKIERKINKLVEDNEAAKANIQAKLKKAEADKIEAENEIDAAADADDDMAFHKAKEKLRYAEDTIEMCSNKMNTLEAALCSEAEGEEVKREINAESEKAERAAEKKAATLVSELYKLSQELNRTIDDNNRLLEKWCAIVLKDCMPPKYYNKSASEVIYLGNMICRRKDAKESFRTEDGNALSIYSYIK